MSTNVVYLLTLSLITLSVFDKSFGASLGVVQNVINGYTDNIPSPGGIASTADGLIFVTDQKEGYIFLGDSSGYVVPIAGSGTQLSYVDTGDALTVTFWGPHGLVWDPQANILYVADRYNHRIRAISVPDPRHVLNCNCTESVSVSTVAGSATYDELKDGLGTAAKFFEPTGLAFDRGRGLLYIADSKNHAVRTFNILTGDVRTLAGYRYDASVMCAMSNGVGTLAQFCLPFSVAYEPNSALLYVSDSANHVIRRIDSAGNVVTFVGSGQQGFSDATTTSAWLNYPVGMTIGYFPLSTSADHRVLIFWVDALNHKVRVATPDGDVRTLIGDDKGSTEGPFEQALLSFPIALHFLQDSYTLLISDRGNKLVRKAVYSNIAEPLPRASTDILHVVEQGVLRVSAWIYMVAVGGTAMIIVLIVKLLSVFEINHKILRRKESQLGMKRSNSRMSMESEASTTQDKVKDVLVNILHWICLK